MKAKALQIILDTNVLLAAARSTAGTSFRLLSLIGDPRFETNLSVPLVLEYEAVLKRPEHDLTMSHQEIDDVLDFLCETSNLRRIHFLWRAALRDPNDDFLLELAVESNCDYIITFNTKDFLATDRFGIRAIRPIDFLRIIGEIR